MREADTWGIFYQLRPMEHRKAKMKNVLVLGGSYFCGRVFIETLNRLGGSHISVFNRGNIPIGLTSVSEFHGDREKANDISENLPERHWDVVVDFCAYSAEHIESLLDNLRGSIDHYILISTTSVYTGNSEVPLKENADKVEYLQPELGDFADYGFHKWRAERALKQHCVLRNIAYTILRPAIIYGRYNYAPRESYFFDAIIDGETVIVPEWAPARFSFVWVDDVAQIILCCFQNKKVYGQAFNLSGPESVSYEDLVSLIQTACDKPFNIMRMPIDQIVREQIALPYPPDTYLLYDGAAIQLAIEFEYTPLVQGMSRTWQHYQAFIQRKRQQHGMKS
jgi:2'-hydroxyisoflavone reductase